MAKERRRIRPPEPRGNRERETETVIGGLLRGPIYRSYIRCRPSATVPPPNLLDPVVGLRWASDWLRSTASSWRGIALAKVRPTQVDTSSDARRRTRRAWRATCWPSTPTCPPPARITWLDRARLGREPAFAGCSSPPSPVCRAPPPALCTRFSLTAALPPSASCTIVFGELVPKSIAIRAPRGTTLWTRCRSTASTARFPRHLCSTAPQPACCACSAPSRLRARARPHRGGAALLLASHTPLSSPREARPARQRLRALRARARQSWCRAPTSSSCRHEFARGDLALARTSGHTASRSARRPSTRRRRGPHQGSVPRRAPAGTWPLARPIHRAETTPLDKLLARCAAHLHLGGGGRRIRRRAGGALENVIEEIVGRSRTSSTSSGRSSSTARRRLQVSGAMLVADLEDEARPELAERDEDTSPVSSLRAGGGRASATRRGSPASPRGHRTCRANAVAPSAHPAGRPSV